MTFQVGDLVQINTGGHGGLLWEEGVVERVRPDGKLCVLVDRQVIRNGVETIAMRRIVRGTAFVRRPPQP